MTAYAMWLSEAMTILNCSRSALAKAANVNVGIINQIMIGNIQTPSKENWNKITAAVLGMESGVIDYRKKSRKSSDVLATGEPARYAVLAIMRNKGWTVYGVYPSYNDAVAVASSLLPLRGGEAIDAFVFRECDF